MAGEKLPDLFLIQVIQSHILRFCNVAYLLIISEFTKHMPKEHLAKVIACSGLTQILLAQVLQSCCVPSDAEHAKS